MNRKYQCLNPLFRKSAIVSMTWRRKYISNQLVNLSKQAQSLHRGSLHKEIVQS